MSKVGIIANPFASMDIRRLVAHASTMGSYQKVGIVRRVILALNWAGVNEILIMPDRDNLGYRALTDVGQHRLLCRVSIMDMPITNEAEDSMRAAQIMSEQNVDCIITMGGDGTNRIVARACGCDRLDDDVVHRVAVFGAGRDLAGRDPQIQARINGNDSDQAIETGARGAFGIGIHVWVHERAAGEIVPKQNIEPRSERLDAGVPVAVLVQDAVAYDIKAQVVDAVGHRIDGVVVEQP